MKLNAWALQNLQKSPARLFSVVLEVSEDENLFKIFSIQFEVNSESMFKQRCLSYPLEFRC